jgi:Y_Y_Y domain/Two component regulator propeller
VGSALQHDPKNGALWVGTYGGGVYRLDPVAGRFTPYLHDPADPRSLSRDAVADLHMDRSGVLWIGTRGGGLNRFDPTAGTFSVYRHDPTNPRSLSNDWASAIAEAPDGTLWIGTLGSGLNRLDPATGMISHYQHDSQDPTSLGDDNIWTLHVDRSGVLWIGTVGGGLDSFDPHRSIFTHYRERDGLASDRIVSILEDGQPGDRTAGDLWIGTGRGLSKLDRDRKTFHVYGTSQGLPLTEFNRGGYTTARGELLMTSIHGLIAFNPNAVPEDRAAAPVVFTSFLLANKPVPVGERSPLHQTIDQTDSIALTYADRVISLEFAALNYRAARQTRYRYKLEGFDGDWIEIDSTKRLVTYTNLVPSRYVFRVASANADGVWNPAGRAIALIITPAWWTTWWFRGLAFALVAGCAAGAFAWRVSSIERRRRRSKRRSRNANSARTCSARVTDRFKISPAGSLQHRRRNARASRATCTTIRARRWRGLPSTSAISCTDAISGMSPFDKRSPRFTRVWPALPNLFGSSPMTFIRACSSISGSLRPSRRTASKSSVTTTSR